MNFIRFRCTYQFSLLQFYLIEFEYKKWRAYMNSELREKILNTISKNSRYSAKELAAMLGSDETAVTNELKQME